MGMERQLSSFCQTWRDTPKPLMWCALVQMESCLPQEEMVCNTQYTDARCMNICDISTGNQPLLISWLFEQMQWFCCGSSMTRRSLTRLLCSRKMKMLSSTKRAGLFSRPWGTNMSQVWCPQLDTLRILMVCFQGKKAQLFLLWLFRSCCANNKFNI